VAVREAGKGLAISAGADPNWTSAAPYEGARAVALENATNLAAKGARPLAAVDCLNGGNPEKPDVYGGFRGIVDGLADMCRTLSVPVVGGNVSLYNDSVSGPIPPTPTLAMVGVSDSYDAPPAQVAGAGTLLVVGASGTGLGGSELLARFGGSDRFPALPSDPTAVVEALADVAEQESTLAVHDVSHGGLAVTLAEMVGRDAGVDAEIDSTFDCFEETPGRAVVETTAPGRVRARFDGVAPVTEVGESTSDGTLTLDVDGGRLSYDYEELRDLRNVLIRELE
jgi:phosphoribosylformylglycinamidine synthase